MDSLYTHNIIKYIYAAKERLPADFPLNTAERELYGNIGAYDTIVIIIAPRHFDWRTVEDRLEIAMTIENLKNLIREEGVNCEIEKA